MIDLKKIHPGPWCELGGGANRHPHVEINVDARAAYDPEGKLVVNFQADFNLPFTEEHKQAMKADEWGGVYSAYTIEHISWRNVRQFLSEVLRILQPGGFFICTTANTLAQMQWILNNPEGWDNKDIFDSASGVLFGDNDYNENTHRSFFSPNIISDLMLLAGFAEVQVKEYGERKTDLLVVGKKPGLAPVTLVQEQREKLAVEGPEIHIGSNPPEASKLAFLVKAPNKELEKASVLTGMTRESLFDKAYFNGGGKVGGYAREGLRDFPVHEVTARHILARHPETALEIGAARGYLVKRLQDKGMKAHGLEISKHCYMTRVCEEIIQHDLCKTPWPIRIWPDDGLERYDLCYSVATMEHIPEEFLPAIIKEMERTCRHGLHGIDFGEHDDGFDKTHCTLKPKVWWLDQFKKHAPDWPVEIVDKENLERGEFPLEVQRGDGKIKLNIGSYLTMHHYGWINIDVFGPNHPPDLNQFAQQQGYIYKQCDVRGGLSYPTGSVDLINCQHMLEHLSYKEGASFLKECRRVLKKTGVMRIAVPEARYLIDKYIDNDLDEYAEISDGVANASTQLGKLWSLLYSGHQAVYDGDTLTKALAEAGFMYHTCRFRQSVNPQILKEVTDMFPCLSLYMDATPKTA